MKVGIVGMGVIGKAQARMFGKHVHATYDPARDDLYPHIHMRNCDFIVVCVGTPAKDDGSANLHFLTRAVLQLPNDVPVLLRSTVPPGTTDRLFFGRTVCHAPEFMGENPSHPWRESTDVPYLILGGDDDSRSFFLPKLQDVFPGVIHECSALEAELTKYTANLYWATRVTFVNEMAEICAAFGADYENVRSAWLADPRMTDAYTGRKGFDPGFGGRCWPKDLTALVVAAEAAGYKPGFLAAVDAANRRFAHA